MMKVGDIAYVVEHVRNKPDIIHELPIEKIGTKYVIFTRYRWMKLRFDKSTLENDGGHSKDYSLFLSKQDYEDAKEYKQLSQALKAAFGYLGRCPFTLEQLRDVARVLGLGLSESDTMSIGAVDGAAITSDCGTAGSGAQNGAGAYTGKYCGCGKPNNSSDADILCDGCRLLYGHSRESEL